MAEKVILGIDQGTTGTRASIMGTAGNILSRAYKTHQQIHPKAGWVEHDPIEIWDCTKSVMVEAFSKLSGTKIIAGIGIANQGETVMLWHRETGEPLHRAIVWQDTRTQAYMHALIKNEALRKRVTHKTGLRLDPYFSASKINWLLHNIPLAKELLRSGKLCAGTMDAWLIFKLTTGESFVTDHSTAARTLLFNIHTLTYDQDLLDLFEISREILPSVQETASNFGVVSGIGNGIDGTPIVVSMVDQPSATFAHGCIEPGTTKATYGTGCFVYMNTGDKVRPSRHGLLSTICWRVNARTIYALDGGIFAAGSVINWMRDRLGLFSNEKEIDAMVTKTIDSGGVLCVPCLTGLAAPYWNRAARAAWFGMGLDTSSAHLVRAALDGIAFRVAQVVLSMEKDSGLKIKALRVDGGLTASSYLMQAQADFLGVPVDVSNDPEATVLGVSILAAKTLDLFLPDTEQSTTITRRYDPNLSQTTRNHRLAEFARAVNLVEKFSRRN